METRTLNGVTYQRSGPGEPWQRVGGGRMIPKSETTQRKEGADADRAQAEALRAQAEAGVAPQRAAADVARAQADVSKAPSEIAKTSAEAAIAARKADDISGGIAFTDEQRGLILNQYRTLGNLATGVNELRSLYDNNLKGRNPLEGRVGNFRPQDKVFDDASGGLSAYVAGALGLSGQQFNTPGEQQLFIGSILPKASDTDEQIVQKLNRLEGLIERAKGQGRQILGITPERDPLATDPAIKALESRVSGPIVLPRAAGVHAASSPEGTLVDNARGGTFQVPELKGLADEVNQMVAAGMSADEVLRHVEDRQRAAGIAPIQGQVDFIRKFVADHQARPDLPLSRVGDPTNLEYREYSDQGGSVTGRVGLSPLGSGIMSAGNAFTAGNLANLAGGDAAAVLDASRAENPTASLVGDITGSGLAMAGVGKLAPLIPGGGALTSAGGIGGDMLYGFTRGASETEGDAGDKIIGGLLGTGAAAAGNVGGRATISAIGNTARGVTSPAIRLLNERGVSLTPGQIIGQGGWLGPRLSSLENAIESVPFIGGNIRDRRLQGIGDYGRAQLEENLAPIGYTPPPGQFGGDMLADAQRAVGDSYGFLNGRTFQSDPQFVDELAAALDAGRSVPRLGDEFGAVMDRQISPLLNPDGTLTGRGFQDALQTLRPARSDFARDGAMGEMAADAIGEVEAALMGMVERQAPDVVDDLGRANAAYAGLVPIENASISATNAAGGANQFTPAQYGRAAVNNARRYGGRAAAARGDIPGGELQRAAQEVLPSVVPNSGTADRAMAALLLPAALGGGGAYASQYTDDPLLAAILLSLAGASTRTGQRLIQRGFVDRPEVVRDAGNYIYQLRDRGGKAGSALAASSVPWLLANE